MVAAPSSQSKASADTLIAKAANQDCSSEQSMFSVETDRGATREA